MVNEVDSDVSDFNGASRWSEMWLPIFFSLEVVVMVVSFGLNLCLLRAVAKNGQQKETPVYLFILWLFFTKLVEDAVIVGQFIKYEAPKYNHTTAMCQFETFVVLGNRILQVNTVLAMLYYSWCHTELKKTVIENRAKQWFPLIVLALLVVEFVLVIGPSVNLRASQMHQRCYYSTDASTAGWLYLWVFPYLLPLALAAPPMARIAMKLRDASYNMTESQKTQNYVVLSTCGGYFFFQLLYYTLTLWYLMAKDKEGFRAVVWFLLRPMFALIGYGWHVVTPLAPFVFDKDLYGSFPGNLVYRKRFEMRQEDETKFNSINLTPTNTWPSSNNNASGSESKVTFQQQADQSPSEHHREFNNPVVMEVEISLEDDRDLNNSSIA